MIKYPYSDVHTMNLDWILNKIKEMEIKIENFSPYSPGIKTVKDYGAMGDGFTDDSNAIQECFKNENVIIFPSATYLIANDIAPLSGNKIVIGFPNATILEDAEATVAFSNLTNIVVNGLTFKSGSNKPSANIIGYRSKNITIENCIFENAKKFNVQMSTCGNTTIRNCKMLGTDEHCGISLSIDAGFENTEYGSGGWTVINGCYITECGLDGIIANNYHVAISNCTITNCGNSTPAAGIYQNNKRDLRVTNCTIKDCTGNGLDIIYSIYVDVSDCMVEHCKSAGFFFAESGLINLSNCFAYNNGYDPIDNTQNSGFVFAKSGANPCNNLYLSHCFAVANKHYGYRFFDCINAYRDICYAANNVDGDMSLSGSIKDADYSTVLPENL